MAHQDPLTAYGVALRLAVTRGPEQRASLNKAAYRRLRADILSCRLSPGRHVTEKQLVANTGHSVAALRDALTRLDQEGLIRTAPRKGYQVVPLTEKSVSDLFVMWRIVGPELVRLGVAHADGRALAQARAGFAALDEIAHDIPGAGKAASRLLVLLEETFRILAYATDNDYLINVFDRICGDMARVWVLILQVDPTAAIPAPTGSRVGDMLRQRDADRAAESARTYIAESHRRVLRVISRRPSVMKGEPAAPPEKEGAESHDRESGL
ncbi:GntR family transcriptional regulator [Streptomyces sp. BH105]|uniref:GntR family transcriptional regulator n=1 Tax=Streptomyces sp. BH105 TaxID=3410408 RepID=UPI003CE74E11